MSYSVVCKVETNKKNDEKTKHNGIISIKMINKDDLEDNKQDNEVEKTMRLKTKKGVCKK